MYNLQMFRSTTISFHKEIIFCQYRWPWVVLGTAITVWIGNIANTEVGAKRGGEEVVVVVVVVVLGVVSWGNIAWLKSRDKRMWSLATSILHFYRKKLPSCLFV